MPGGWEWLIIGVIGLLLFGRRLPEVGRSLGRGIVEFKKGIHGIEDDIDQASGAKGKPAVASGDDRAALREPQQWSDDERRVSKADPVSND
ncbi:MAG: twin-arginine translocase TatA/TatE family subunit [Planctomycetota bacterium]|nr:twin-arginine translocase TatA/TatE family subunit [Planctomycetota bacterium]